MLMDSYDPSSELDDALIAMDVFDMRIDNSDLLKDAVSRLAVNVELGFCY